MPDPSHRPYKPMTIIRPNKMPAFWWLFPWAYARQLHRNCNALKSLCDRQDDLLRGKYTTRPRWVIEHWEDDNGVRYYFHDTDPELDRAKETSVLRGKAYLHDGPSKSFVYDTDPAKAIERVTELNAK